MAMTSIYVLRMSPSCLLPLRECPRSASASDLVLSNYCFLSWVSKTVRFCVQTLRADSVSYSPLALLKVSCTGLQSKVFWGLFWYRIPGLESLTWGLDPLLLRENLYSCDYPPLWEFLTWGVGFDQDSAPPTQLTVVISLYFHLWRIFPASLQVILINSYSLNSYNSGGHVGGSQLRFFLLHHAGHLPLNYEHF